MLGRNADELALLAAGGTWPVFEEGELKWSACRGKNGGGMDKDSNGERYTCHLLTW